MCSLPGFTSGFWDEDISLGPGRLFLTVLAEASPLGLSAHAGGCRNTPVRSALPLQKADLQCQLSIHIWALPTPQASNKKSALPCLSEKQHLSAPGPSSWVLFFVGLFQSTQKSQGGLAALLWAFRRLLILDLLSQLISCSAHLKCHPARICVVGMFSLP